MLKPCLNCGELSNKARCHKCSIRVARLREQARPTRSERGYDAEWRRLSKLLRSLQPFCSICKTTKDLTVDHIVPLSAGGSTVISNLQVLCRKCNSRKGGIR